ncbi:hypothetical protein HDG32_001348 [Paraburkholderia sp. CI2]|nr:hypothetical protein [Paraburkholderia sp. CI2]
MKTLFLSNVIDNVMTKDRVFGLQETAMGLRLCLLHEVRARPWTQCGQEATLLDGNKWLKFDKFRPFNPFGIG